MYICTYICVKNRSAFKQRDNHESITRFPLRRFSPGAGLLRHPLFTLSALRFSRGWVRKDGNLLTETGCNSNSNGS